MMDWASEIVSLVKLFLFLSHLLGTLSEELQVQYALGSQLYHCMEVKLSIPILGIQNDEIQVLSLYEKHKDIKIVAGALGD